MPAVGDVSSNYCNRCEKTWSLTRWPLGIVEELIVGKDGKIGGAKVRTKKSQIKRAVQHLYPLELSVDKKEPVPAILNPKADTFRAKRDAAVAAKLRVQEIVEDEQ